MADSRAIERVPYVFITPSISAQRLAYHASQVLRSAYALLFLLTGVDKYVSLLTHWEQYLSDPVRSVLPIDAHTFLLVVGAWEVFGGILIAAVPRIGGFAAAVWLLAVAGNLLFLPGYEDVALRNAALAAGALVLGRLARSRRRQPLPPWL